MGPPRDRLAAMQQAAYFEEGDDYGVQMQEAMDGKNQYLRIYLSLGFSEPRFYINGSKL